MLTIDRKEKQSVFLDDLKLTVEKIENRIITLKVNDKFIKLKHGQRIEIGEVEVLFSSQFRSGIQLAFDAPHSIRILREELYHRGNKLKYVDNSTKQFPSGGNC